MHRFNSGDAGSQPAQLRRGQPGDRRNGRAGPALLEGDSVAENLVAWIIPKDALSSCFSTPGIT